MSYTIKVEKTLMQIPLAKALPGQQQCARECSLQIYSLAEGWVGGAAWQQDSQHLGTWALGLGSVSLQDSLGQGSFLSMRGSRDTGCKSLGAAKNLGNQDKLIL